MAAAERLQMGLAEQAEVVKRERRELEERESQLVSVSFLGKEVDTECDDTISWCRKDWHLLASVENIRKITCNLNSFTPNQPRF